MNGPPLLFGRLARVTVVLNRVRIGTAFVDGYGEFDGWSGNTVLPLRVGYTLLSRPVKTQFIYGAVPDVYVELSGSPWGPDSVTGALGFRYGPSLRAALCCDVDYGGVGARFETGWVDIYRDDLFLGPITRKSFLYAGLQLRLVTFGIGF